MICFFLLIISEHETDVMFSCNVLRISQSGEKLRYFSDDLSTIILVAPAFKNIFFRVSKGISDSGAKQSFSCA